MSKKIVITISQVWSADIILTTGDHKVSKMIRNAIGSDISHSMIYLGNREIIDSTDDGVQMRQWDKASDGVTLAIVLRRRNMDQKARDAVVAAAKQYNNLPYDYIGAVRYVW
jgi:uncharacterized protein YycO